jgi:hypothetical protein
MNDRIRELLQQSTNPPWDGEQGPMNEFNLERFTQLVVFECVNAVMDGTKEGDHYAQRIEQHFNNGPGGILHFGVKE